MTSREELESVLWSMASLNVSRSAMDAVLHLVDEYALNSAEARAAQELARARMDAEPEPPETVECGPSEFYDQMLDDDGPPEPDERVRAAVRRQGEAATRRGWYYPPPDWSLTVTGRDDVVSLARAIAAWPRDDGLPPTDDAETREAWAEYRRLANPDRVRVQAPVECGPEGTAPPADPPQAPVGPAVTPVEADTPAPEPESPRNSLHPDYLASMGAQPRSELKLRRDRKPEAEEPKTADLDQDAFDALMFGTDPDPNPDPDPDTMHEAVHLAAGADGLAEPVVDVTPKGGIVRHPGDMLHCKKCGTDKAYAMFARDKSVSTGRRSSCTACDARAHGERKKAKGTA